MIITRPCEITLWCLGRLTLEAFNSIFFFLAPLISSGQGRGGGIPEERVRPSGHLLETAKGWELPKACFLNWAEFFNKGPVLETGFYLLTKSIDKTGKKKYPHSGMPGHYGGLLLCVLLGKFWIYWQTFPSFTSSSGGPISLSKGKCLSSGPWPRWDMDVWELQA